MTDAQAGAAAPKNKRPEQIAHDYLVGPLNVHGVYDTAAGMLDTLATCHDEIITARRNRRNDEEAIADREAELYNEHRPNFDSQAAFDKGIKPILQLDPELRTLRASHRAAQEAQDRAEMEAREAEQAIRINSARMTELGGITSFLASVKNSINNTDQANQAKAGTAHE